jgi:hypothetical protein
MPKLEAIAPSKITKRVSPQDFLKIVESKPDSIKKSRIILPKLGSRTLSGFIEIEYK